MVSNPFRRILNPELGSTSDNVGFRMNSIMKLHQNFSIFDIRRILKCHQSILHINELELIPRISMCTNGGTKIDDHLYLPIPSKPIAHNFIFVYYNIIHCTCTYSSNNNNNNNHANSAGVLVVPAAACWLIKIYH